jgi:putative ABC transport system permease protein
MGVSKPGYSDRLYAALLRLLPFDFRSEFGGDMEETFRAQRDDAERSSGFRALLRIWWATIVDIVAMAPREHWSVLRQDVRYALRMIRKNSGYTAVAVAILAVGIGVNTAVFSMVNAVLFRPLPYLEGDRLIVLRQTAHKAGFNDLSFSAQEIADYRRRNRTLSGLVEYHSMSFTLYGGDEARSVRTGVVSAEFFDFFGIKPLIGRSFLPADDRPGAQPVLMLSYEFWKPTKPATPV